MQNPNFSNFEMMGKGKTGKKRRTRREKERIFLSILHVYFPRGNMRQWQEKTATALRYTEMAIVAAAIRTGNSLLTCIHAA